MKSIQLFNGLSGTVASRGDLLSLRKLAKIEKQYHLVDGITSVLKSNPNFTTFDIKITEPIQAKQENEIIGLSAAEIELFDIDELNEVEYVGLNGIPQQEIYDLVTNQLISNLEDLKNWQSGFTIDQSQHIFAINFKTKKPYRGINQMLLGGNPMLGTMLENPYYLTFKQVEELGGTIVKGAKSKDAIFYTILYNYKGFKTNDRDKFIQYLRSTGQFAENQIPGVVFAHGYGIIRIYNVFNGKDIDGIDWNLPTPAKNIEKIVEKIEICEKIISKYPVPAPKILYKGSQPAFYPFEDKIQMPKPENWEDMRSFYAVLFHELVHSTGIKIRLNRGNDTHKRDGSKKDKQAYAFEELVAEIGASFVCANAGIFYFTKENAKTYIAGWRQNIVAYLKQNNKGIFMASAKAQKAADFMLKNITDDDFLASNDQEVKPKAPKKQVIKTVKSSKSITKVVTNVQKKTKEKPYFTFSKNGSFEIPIGLIFTDEKRFQNRNKLDQRIINNIVKNFDVNQFDPIVIWQDANPKYGHTGRYFVLAGHHRFEAVKQLGYKTIQTKISNYTEKEAIKYAKETSNANRTLELPQERAKIYRKHIAGDNLSRKELLELAKTNEGKNGNYIVNLAYLNAHGLMIQALDQLSETPDKQNATIIEKMADWIGEARKLHNEILNDANEFEMFKFLQDKSQSERIKTKAEFLQKITAATGVFFKAGDVLNLTRFTNKTEGENVYDAEYKELQKQLEMAVENKQSLLDRIKNPKNTGFIDPKDKDYKNIIVALENAIEKYNNQIKLLQTKIIDLSRKKGNYTNAGSNQVGLFGSKSIKLSSYTIASNCTDLTDANDGFNEVYDAIKEYKKLGKKIPALWYTRSSKLVDRIKHFEIKEGLGVINENVESILFNRQIIKIAKKGIINNDKILSLGKPFSILGNFIENFEITVSGSVIEKALSQSKDHNLNWGNFIDLPKNINNPVAIFISKTKGYVVLTKIKDINKKSVIVALHIDKQRKSCKIASMYIRSNPNTYKNWIDDNLHIYINEKSELYTYQQATIAIGGITHNAKVTKTIPNNNNTGLNFSQPEKKPARVQKKITEVKPKITVLAKEKNIDLIQSKKPVGDLETVNKNSVAYKREQNKNQVREYYTIPDPEIAKFLGKIEKKKNESVAITVGGEEGSMKTRFCFQLINAFGQNYKVGHASIEEHPSSSLYDQKVDQYLNNKAQNNVENPEIDTINDIINLVKNNDVIVIDSFTKLQEMQKGIELDKDFRKKYNGKLFIIIYQLTTNKTMRGGSKSQFDGDIVTIAEKFPDYTKNYIQATKNRYNDIPATELKFNIFTGKMIGQKTNNNIKLKFKL